MAEVPLDEWFATIAAAFDQLVEAAGGMEATIRGSLLGEGLADFAALDREQREVLAAKAAEAAEPLVRTRDFLAGLVTLEGDVGEVLGRTGG